MGMKIGGKILQIPYFLIRSMVRASVTLPLHLGQAHGPGSGEDDKLGFGVGAGAVSWVWREVWAVLAQPESLSQERAVGGLSSRDEGEREVPRWMTALAAGYGEGGGVGAADARKMDRCSGIWRKAKWRGGGGVHRL
uniref:Uncharacterized protein n=1 Tax=Oryza glumipatula TaxID=40148 RepID=A0A0D9ZM43_9ORYZ